MSILESAGMLYVPTGTMRERRMWLTASYAEEGGPNGSTCCYIGDGVIASRGFDSEINGNLLDNWKLFAGYTYNQNEYKSGLSTGVVGYLVANARVEYRINPSWSASLNVNNIFDKVYYETVGDTSAGNFYRQPRNWVLSLRSRW